VLDSNNPEIRVDEIMQRIQEKVRATRGASPPRQSTTIGGSLEIPRWQALDDSLARAQDVAHVGAGLPAMSRVHGLKRTVATGVARAFLRIAQLITRDQRTFNLTVLDALRLLYDRARDDAAQVAALRRDLDAARAEIASVREQGARLRAALSLQERRIDVLADGGSRQPTSSTASDSTSSDSPRVSDATYLHFEDEFRGPREIIKERAAVYLPLVREALARTNDAPILDLGCGRGELLEVLRAEGLRASGVDANHAAVEQCRALRLDVDLRDVFEALRGTADETLGAVTAMHLVEHLPFPQVVLLLDEMIRVLRPGGVAILETPNPQNVLVGSSNFYIDPTHRNPVHPRTLRFLMEARGLDRVETMMLHPSREQRVPDSDSELARRFNDYFYGPQDFAAIGYRP
jgi:2-polyprenyl-3-methyl-5-hydroxy-6-metoxy-1,4-benzoquinol methylase